VSNPTLYAAVDILGGKAVRLTQGSFEQSTVYDEDPLTAASRWVDEGAEALHVVDLDGAKEGSPSSIGHLERIARLPVTVQYGGGLRSLETLEAALSAGADRIVIGTAAFTDPDLLSKAIERFGEQVAAAVDVRGGLVATKGWLEQSELSGIEAVRRLRDRGVTSVVYTSVDRDGMLGGINPNDVDEVSEAVGEGRFVYSGGISSLADLIDAACAHNGNLEGVIVGKALYERRFEVRDAKRVLEDPNKEAKWER
jgi:phosphoribosylformimino-5-aminoimidazole carboxamide ribotide isomerase